MKSWKIGVGGESSLNMVVVMEGAKCLRSNNSSHPLPYMQFYIYSIVEVTSDESKHLLTMLEALIH